MEINQQKAVVQLQYGLSKDVLQWSDSYPVVPPAADEIQIRVHATSVNPIDWQMIEGNRRLIHKRKFPYVPFFDIAGEVISVGALVKRFKTGDAVLTDNKINGGGLSEYVNVKENLVSLKPSNISYPEAAAIPLAAQTAYLCLARGGINKNSRVLVIGASGGVGTFAVQTAKAMGAKEVTGVCSTRNIGLVKSLGADVVVDYTKDKWSDYLEQNSVDMIVDCVGGKEQWIGAKKILKPKGRFVTISRDEDGEVTISSALKLAVNISYRMICSLFGKRIKYIPVFLDASADLLDKVVELVQSGKVKPFIQKQYMFTMNDVHQIIADSKQGRMVGKSVIVVSEDTL